MYEQPIREVLKATGVRLADVAGRAGVGVPCVSRQLRGERYFSPAMRAAVREALLARAQSSLTLTAMLLRRHGEGQAADACERLWERLSGTESQTIGSA